MPPTRFPRFAPDATGSGSSNSLGSCRATTEKKRGLLRDMAHATDMPSLIMLACLEDAKREGTGDAINRLRAQISTSIQPNVAGKELRIVLVDIGSTANGIKDAATTSTTTTTPAAAAASIVTTAACHHPHHYRHSALRQ